MESDTTVKLSQTESLPGVDAYAEELTAAKDNQPMKWHRVCKVCHPDANMGTPAVCGEKVLGIPARKEAGNGCDACLKAWPRHVMNHMYNGGSSRG